MSGVLALALGSVVDRSLQLIRARHDHKKSIFENCVEPLYDAVDKTHANYTNTFTEYRELIRQCDESAKADMLLDRVAADMTLTVPLRVKVEKLRLNAHHPELRSYRDRVGAYVRAIVRSHSIDEFDNAPRLCIIAQLDRILSNRASQGPIVQATRQRAGVVIDRQLRTLNVRFAGVVGEYELIRSQQIL